MTAKSTVASQELRIQELEKQLEFTKTQTLKVSVSDMNEMYSNHLKTLDLALGVIAFVIVLGGGVFGWLGYKSIRQMTRNRIDRIVGKKTEEKIEEALKPLRKEYEAIITKQKNQENKIQAEHYMSQGYRDYSAQKYNDAIENLTKALKLQPDMIEALTYRGLAKSKIRKDKEAIKDYDRLIKLDSKDYAAYCNRANSKSVLGEYESAMTDIDEALLIQPDDPTSNYNKACLLALMNKDTEQVLTFLEKAIKLDKKYFELSCKDRDFKSLYKNKKFKKLVGLDKAN